MEQVDSSEEASSRVLEQQQRNDEQQCPSCTAELTEASVWTTAANETDCMGWSDQQGGLAVEKRSPDNKVWQVWNWSAAGLAASAGSVTVVQLMLSDWSCRRHEPIVCCCTVAEMWGTCLNCCDIVGWPPGRPTGILRVLWFRKSGKQFWYLAEIVVVIEIRSVKCRLSVVSGIECINFIHTIVSSVA